MAPTDLDAPLPSAPVDDEEEDDEDDDAPEPEGPRPRPPAPTFSFSWTTFVYVFCGMLGLWMLVSSSDRNSIAGLLGTSASAPGPLYWLIGFGSSFLLLTMLLAGALEMLITSLAYNVTTDWVKAAKVQKWSAAFRKVQMEAIRSGKKDRIAALRPHQERLARLSGEVSIAQFKGMAITYFLLILIYTWVGLVIAHAPLAAQSISLNGSTIDLTHRVVSGLPVPWWFLIFSVYTIPFSMVFRRFLKHAWLRRYLAEHPPSAADPAPGAARGTAGAGRSSRSGGPPAAANRPPAGSSPPSSASSSAPSARCSGPRPASEGWTSRRTVGMRRATRRSTGSSIAPWRRWPAPASCWMVGSRGRCCVGRGSTWRSSR